jgi:hypothetical protein
MMKRLLSAAVALVLAASAPIGGQELGTITFPTSGAKAAQAPFLEGVKNLHTLDSVWFAGAMGGA